ncbi:MAG: hypothetical protein AB7S78_02395 [Candidatus Omnitrophota bacterium]
MVKKQTITIYFHKPSFTREEVRAYLKLKTWPKMMKFTVGWEDIKHMVAGGTFNAQSIKSLSYLLWILSPEFHFSKWGLFLTDFDRRFNPEKYVKHDGRFKSEGLINHIQLQNVVKNRTAQFETGARAIRAWGPALKNFRYLRETVIYLTGPDNYTLAVYSDPKKQEIASLNRMLSKDKTLVKMRWEDFVKWAL